MAQGLLLAAERRQACWTDRRWRHARPHGARTRHCSATSVWEVLPAVVVQLPVVQLVVMHASQQGTLVNSVLHIVCLVCTVAACRTGAGSPWAAGEVLVGDGGKVLCQKKRVHGRIPRMFRVGGTWISG